MKKNIISVVSTVLLLPGVLGTLPAMAASNTSASSKANPMVNMTTQDKQKLAETLKQEAKISKDKAISLATSFMSIPSGYKQDNVSFNTNWYPDNRSVWQIIWRKSDGQVTGSLNITVDANSGAILAMNRYENNPNQQSSYPPKVDHNKAISIAKAFIAKQFPDKITKISYDDQSSNMKPPLKGNVHYTLRFVRTIHNIMFRDNYIMVTIDGDGNITGMDYRWNNNLSFPLTSGILSQGDAEKQMKMTLPLQLHYLTLHSIIKPLPVKKDQPSKVVLTYSNIGNFTMLDAKSGKWRDYSGNILDTPQSATKLNPLADNPLTAPPSIGPEMSQDQAENQIIKKLDLSSSLVMQRANYNDQWGSDKQPVWNFSWQSNDKKASINATINAKTGEILNFNLYDPTLYPSPSEKDNWTPSITYEAAKQKAINMIKKLVPYKMDQLVFNTLSNPESLDQSKQRVYHFNFQRLVNGVLVPTQSINIGISAEKGGMVSFYQNWNNKQTFPNPDHVVSIDQAKDQYLSNFSFNLVYKMVRPNPVHYNQMNQANDAKVMLVYEFKQKNSGEPVYFDAEKNQWLSQSTGEPVTQNTKAIDISGSWAEKPLQLMIDYGALKPDEHKKVYPNQPITKGQMVKMLMLATNPNPIFYEKMASASKSQAFSDVNSSSPYYDYIQVAVQKGWIDQNTTTYKPNNPVTREELADLIVHALNYDKLASVKGLFNLNFKDMGQITKQGDVAIVSHLGIMKGSHGYFRPTQKATKAQAAVAFYQFLEKQGEYGK